jgi:RNA polymerase sigma factor (sigma-70 family)
LNVLKIPYEYSDIEQCEHLFVVEVDLLDELIDREQAAMRVQIVKSLLNTLTDRQREAIYLRYMQKLSYDEIADMLGLTQKGARKLVARGIEHMREEATSSVILLFLVIFPPDWI